MQLFGLEVRNTPAITRLNIRQQRLQARASPVLTPVSSRGGWWPLIREPYTGAWQRNLEIRTDSVLAHHAVYACITRIAQDIGKLRAKLVEQDEDGIWTETSSSAFSGVLSQPNRFQNYIQFKEWWATSKLIHGNAYALREMHDRNTVKALYLLDPKRVTPLVAPDGTVFYELRADNLSGLEEDRIAVPASEIIHDRMNCLFHPLVGTSPIFACGVAANMGLEIQNNSSTFFQNGSNPSGILTSPTPITQQQSADMAAIWEARYGPGGPGGIAVLGNGMKFETMRMSATDSQLIEQLQWTAETICSTFHVPPFKIGIGPQPTYQNAEVMNQIYYSDCLQSHIEQFELCMDAALGLRTGTNTGRMLGVELDLDGLLRMDQASQVDALSKAVDGALISTDEARKKMDYKPIPGGKTIFKQQQYFPIDMLTEYHAAELFAKQNPPALPAPEPQKALPPGAPAEDETRSWADLFRRDAAITNTELEREAA